MSFLLWLFIVVSEETDLNKKQCDIEFRGYEDFIVTERQTFVTNKSQFSVIKTINKVKNK